MNGRQFALVLIFTMICAFVGGIISNRFFLGQPVLEQNQLSISAREFRIDDDKGVTRAVLNTGFTLYDSSGRRRIMFEVDRHGNPSANFWDRESDGREYAPADVPSISFLDGSNLLRARMPGARDWKFIPTIAPMFWSSQSELSEESFREVQRKIDEVIRNLNVLING